MRLGTALLGGHASIVPLLMALVGCGGRSATHDAAVGGSSGAGGRVASGGSAGPAGSGGAAAQAGTGGAVGGG
ncbi:MAG TPA: hypothetical protein VIF57_25480, partial [Polyangia bacterium]